MIDKKLEIIEFILKKGILNINQVDSLLTILERCIQRQHSYTKEQLMANFSNLINQRKITVTGNEEDVITRLFSTEIQEDSWLSKNDSRDELLNYQLLNDQCIYMLKTIPMLIKKRIIK